MSKTQIAILKAKALIFERQAEEFAASDAPWAPRNVRIYQDLASRSWSAYFAACRNAGVEP